ncbi:MAG: hypothetical protein CL897_03015 [Dehalococcoidia bacterium]|nr:hypothetical protein [Dehalococcoidia bacterium]HCU99908.1 hypothetical protein [Dehalococcoidia bacterium]|tara:strand:- start:1188 stop:1565 length:378 start_codon:yes stop_codon:yes gene_type:complete
MNRDGSDIQGVAGVVIWTERYQEMLAFYRDVLGLIPRNEKAAFVNFEWGGVRLSVAAHDQVHGPARDPLRIMVNFSVADITAAHKKLCEQGVEFLRPPEEEHWGGWVATFFDPDGNILQLLEFPG